jgi:hypothetical protein
MIRAIWCPDKDRWMQYRTRGSFYLAAREGHQGLFDFWFFCPCGCGQQSCILIGHGFRPGGKERAWRWNGSKTEPAIDPSVTIEHGEYGSFAWWLENGYWAET